MSPDLVINPEVARELAGMSREVGRQIGLLIDRAGRVDSVVVGDQRQIMIPVLSKARGAAGRLKGLRCVHTHLAGEDLTNDDLMDLLFLRLDFMAMLKVTDEGLPEKLYGAHLVPQPVEGRNWVLMPPVVPGQQPEDFQELTEPSKRNSSGQDRRDRLIANRIGLSWSALPRLPVLLLKNQCLSWKNWPDQQRWRFSITLFSGGPSLIPGLSWGKERLAN